MLFNPVRSWATSGKTGGNYGSGRLYQREFFFSSLGEGICKMLKMVHDPSHAQCVFTILYGKKHK